MGLCMCWCACVGAFVCDCVDVDLCVHVLDGLCMYLCSCVGVLMLLHVCVCVRALEDFLKV